MRVVRAVSPNKNMYACDTHICISRMGAPFDACNAVFVRVVKGTHICVTRVGHAAHAYPDARMHIRMRRYCLSFAMPAAVAFADGSPIRDMHSRIVPAAGMKRPREGAGDDDDDA